MAGGAPSTAGGAPLRHAVLCLRSAHKQTCLEGPDSTRRALSPSRLRPFLSDVRPCRRTSQESRFMSCPGSLPPWSHVAGGAALLSPHGSLPSLVQPCCSLYFEA